MGTSRPRRHAATGVAVLLLGLAACDSPSDVVYDPARFTPLLDAAGRYRVTFGPGPDVSRGFTSDGRILYRAFGLAPFGVDWALVSVPPDGGEVREEAAVYRPALLTPLGTLASTGTRSALVTWKEPLQGGHGCPDSSMTTFGNPGPAPRPPTPVEIAIHALGPVIRPISSLPVRSVPLNVSFLDFQGYEAGMFVERRRVRVSPTLRDVNRTGANAFGPVLLGDTEAIYSDGEQLWRADMGDTAVAPLPLGPGAYPALSPDGRSLAYARPRGIDSTVQLFTVPFTIGTCYQTQIEISATGWEVVVRDLPSGAEQVVGQGLDVAWDPSGTRLVVRDGGLKWLDLPSGNVTDIAATEGAFAPAVAPDGRALAFSLFTDGVNADVYFLRSW